MGRRIFLVFFVFLGLVHEPIYFDGCSFDRDPVSVVEVTAINKLGYQAMQFLRRQLFRIQSQLVSNWGNGNFEF